MGAELNSRNYPSLTVAKENWRSDQDAAAYEDGNCYSGNINMLDGDLPDRPDHVLAEGENVYDLLSEHDKFDRPMVIECPDGSVVVGGWCSS